MLTLSIYICQTSNYETSSFSDYVFLSDNSGSFLRVFEKFFVSYQMSQSTHCNVILIYHIARARTTAIVSLRWFKDVHVNCTMHRPGQQSRLGTIIRVFNYYDCEIYRVMNSVLIIRRLLLLILLVLVNTF